MDGESKDARQDYVICQWYSGNLPICCQMVCNLQIKWDYHENIYADCIFGDPQYLQCSRQRVASVAPACGRRLHARVSRSLSYAVLGHQRSLRLLLVTFSHKPIPIVDIYFLIARLVSRKPRFRVFVWLNNFRVRHPFLKLF